MFRFSTAIHGNTLYIVVHDMDVDAKTELGDILKSDKEGFLSLQEYCHTNELDENDFDYEIIGDVKDHEFDYIDEFYEYYQTRENWDIIR